MGFATAVLAAGAGVWMGGLGAQQAPASAGDSPRLTAAQNDLFAQARKDFAAEKWQLSIDEFEKLRNDVPENPVFALFEGEAEVNLNDTAEALKLLSPILAKTPDNGQALAISAHAYAQAGDVKNRDATLARLQILHDAGKFPTQSMVLEKQPVAGGGRVIFFYFLEPYSRYKIYLMARLYNAQGQQVRRVTLESSDGDQPLFVQQHPKEAAAGEREYSMDGYTEQPGQNGAPATQTHFTYGFFVGRPAYDVFKEKVINIASGKASPLSSTSGIPLPAKQ